jgi:hypothetical protein
VEWGTQDPSSEPDLKAADAHAPLGTIANVLGAAHLAPRRQGNIMTITYAGITDRPGFSSAFQAFVNWLRRPRQRRNNGSALVAVDLTERPTVAACSAEGDQSVVVTLTARIETLEAEFAKVEAAAAVHRADFERERERCERLMAEVLKATAELMAAREATARIAGELAAYRARPWWRRLAG